MNQYIFQADIYCEACGLELCRVQSYLKPEDPLNESTWDSDDYPKGPFYSDAESDSPQHCGGCHTFLENGLTPDGYQYVLDILNAKRGMALSAVEQTWADFYGFSLSHGSLLFSLDN